MNICRQQTDQGSSLPPSIYDTSLWLVARCIPRLMIILLNFVDNQMDSRVIRFEPIIYAEISFSFNLKVLQVMENIILKMYLN